jgi:hypothetical protein
MLAMLSGNLVFSHSVLLLQNVFSFNSTTPWFFLGMKVFNKRQGGHTDSILWEIEESHTGCGMESCP